MSPGASPNLIFPEPFSFFHQVPRNGMCISIDLRKYGNEARFVRRSCKPNAEIRSVIGKGTMHAYIVTRKNVELDEEITVAHEFQAVGRGSSREYDYAVAPFPLPCACLDLTTCNARFNETPGLVPELYNNTLVKRNGAISTALTSPILSSE